MTNPIRVAAIAGLLALATSVVQAQSAAAPSAGTPTADDWSFRLGTYGWLTNLSGNVTARGQTVDFNASIIDLFQKSSSLMALNGFVEASKGPFSLHADVVWAKLAMPKSATAYRNPVAGVQLSAQADSTLTTSLTIVELGGAYELAKWPGGDGASTALAAVAGLRYWNISNSLALDITGAVDFSRIVFDRFDRAGRVGIVDSGTRQWVDPLIGLRLRHQFDASQDLVVRGDIGGFGIAGGSAFSWQALAVYSYAWQYDGYAVAALGGYRALSTRFNVNAGLGSVGVDLLIHGPVIGVSVRF